MATDDHIAPQAYHDFASGVLLSGHQTGSMLRAVDTMLERVLNRPQTPALPLGVQEDLMTVVHLIWAARAHLDDVVMQIDRSTLDFNVESVQAAARVEA